MVPDARVGLQSACDEIVAHRRATGDRREDLLGLLLDARDEGSPLSDAEIRDQVLIFLLAGHETTSTALTYALHLLGQHPERATPGPGGGGGDRRSPGPHRTGCRDTRLHDDGTEGDDAPLPVGAVPRPAGGRGRSDQRLPHGPT